MPASDNHNQKQNKALYLKQKQLINTERVMKMKKHKNIKCIKALSLLIFTAVILSVISIPSNAADATAEVETIKDEVYTSEQAILLDSASFVIKSDGTVTYIENVSSHKVISRLSDVVTGTMSYYYLGKNSKKQPTYQIVMNIVSQTNLKSSVLSTKAEGVSSWHNNKASHSGKT